jgi:muramoyltetrapeptide carboxypeptidase LdcA involved in peptidoglycan recycling
VDTRTLAAILGSKPEFAGIPVVAGASFGHTTLQFTFPIGGRSRMSAVGGRVRLTIDEH